MNTDEPPPYPQQRHPQYTTLQLLKTMRFIYGLRGRSNVLKEQMILGILLARQFDPVRISGFGDDDDDRDGDGNGKRGTKRLIMEESIFEGEPTLITEEELEEGLGNELIYGGGNNSVLQVLLDNPEAFLLPPRLLEMTWIDIPLMALIGWTVKTTNALQALEKGQWPLEKRLSVRHVRINLPVELNGTFNALTPLEAVGWFFPNITMMEIIETRFSVNTYINPVMFPNLKHLYLAGCSTANASTLKPNVYIWGASYTTYSQIKSSDLETLIIIGPPAGDSMILELSGVFFKLKTLKYSVPLFVDQVTTSMPALEKLIIGATTFPLRLIPFRLIPTIQWFLAACPNVTHLAYEWTGIDTVLPMELASFPKLSHLLLYQRGPMRQLEDLNQSQYSNRKEFIRYMSTLSRPPPTMTFDNILLEPMLSTTKTDLYLPLAETKTIYYSLFGLTDPEVKQLNQDGRVIFAMDSSGGNIPLPLEQGKSVVLKWDPLTTRDKDAFIVQSVKRKKRFLMRPNWNIESNIGFPVGQ